MKKVISNIAASKRAKIANIALSQGKDVELLRLLYMEERLLYRISQSAIVDKFILKGGLLLYSLFGQTARPTRDIDALAINLPVEPAQLAEVFGPICAMDFPDGVVFESESIQAEVIREGANYQGVRLSVNATLGSARNKIQLDIGFHDVVSPQARQMEYPVLLDDPAPVLSVYSLESMIAEKFEAMISLGAANSRMKDFYDIAQLAQTYDFDGMLLSNAVSQTLRRRRTTCPEQPAVFASDFASDSVRKSRWTAFLKSVAVAPTDFAQTMLLLQTFLGSVYELHRQNKLITQQWNHQSCSWI
jgi:predicted nucleotidyltransferase component of viral defense system